MAAALRIAPAALIIATALALSCAGDGGSNAAPAKAVTTLSVFEDLVREVGGDRAAVSSLLPPGADPHTYEPTPGQVRAIAEADVVFANGLDLEPAVLRVVEPNLSGGATLVELAQETIDAGFAAIAGGEEDEPINPHLWLSVNAAREYVRVIRDALAAADPEGRSEYEANYEEYLARLEELDAYVADKLSAVPEANRKLVTTHDAFGYMADYMGFVVVAVVAESPGQEPSAGDIADLQETIGETGVAAVFDEPQLGAESSVLRRAAADAGADVCTLYSDALDNKVPTYIDLIRHNADELARCLGD